MTDTSLPEGMPRQSKSGRTVSWYRLLLKWAVSLSLLAAAVILLDWDGLRTAFLDIQVSIFVFAVLIIMPEYLLLGTRWFLIVREKAPMPWREHLRRYCLAVFWGSFTPGNIGTDVIRFFSFRKLIDGMTAAEFVLRERILGVVGFAMFYVLCFAIYAMSRGDMEFASPFTIGAAVLTVGLVGFGFADPIFRFLGTVWPGNAWKPLGLFFGLLQRASAAGFSPRTFQLHGLSLIGIVCWTLAIALLADSLDSLMPLAVIGMIGILSDLLRQIPISVQGLGVREGVFAWLFATAGGSAEIGFIVGFASYLALSVSLILVGALGAAIPAQKADIMENT